MDDFLFNGQSFGMVSGGGIVLNKIDFDPPKRDVTEVVVPGRNGVLLIDNGRYELVTSAYICVVDDYKEKRDAIVNLLSIATSWGRLEDTFNPDVFMMAKVDDYSVHAKLKTAKITINFKCMPQRFLLTGEASVNFSAAGNITNPTLFTALPLIVVRGSGSGKVVINGSTVNISNIDSSVTLDSEMERAYKGLTPKDATIGGNFPKLSPGQNTVSFSGGVTSVSITPRWWKI